MLVKPFATSLGLLKSCDSSRSDVPMHELLHVDEILRQFWMECFRRKTLHTDQNEISFTHTHTHTRARVVRCDAGAGIGDGFVQRRTFPDCFHCLAETYVEVLWFYKFVKGGRWC